MSAELQPIVSERRSDGVVERLRALILTGAYPPGSRLPNERELSVALAVNRGSVREVRIRTAMADGRTISFIERRCEVRDRQYDGGEGEFTVLIGRRQLDHLLARGARIRINGMDPLEAINEVWGG